MTEPSPSTLSDLKRVLHIVDHFGIDYGILINKYDLNEDFTSKIEKSAEEMDTEVLDKIPYDRAFVDALVDMEPVVEREEKYKQRFGNIAKKVLERLS